jgi:hypothetical protein
MDNYRVIENRLRPRPSEFKGNSCKGTWVEVFPLSAPHYSQFRVYSYDTLIGTYTDNGFGNVVAAVTPVRYSRTTSRIQNMCRRAWGVK